MAMPWRLWRFLNKIYDIFLQWLAMVWPWQLSAMADHGGAMATLEISEYFTPPNWLAMATFDHGVAMATFDNGWPWRGHGDYGDFCIFLQCEITFC